MAKAPKLGKEKEITEEHLGIKPKKKKIIKKRKRKVTNEEGFKKPKSLVRYSHNKKKKEPPKSGKKQLTEEERKIRSQRAKEYWKNLRENDPEKYAERIRKLQEGKRQKQQEKEQTPTIEDTTPKIETPDIETSSDDSGKQIPLDLEEKPDENGFFINKDTGEVFDNYKDWQASLSNPPSYDPFKTEEDDRLIYEDVVITHFLQDVYARPTLNGSRFILNWIETLIDEYKKSFVAQMINFAKQEGYEIDVKMLYEEDKASAMATGFMQFWYNKGFFAESEAIKNRWEAMPYIQKKMDKEFQGEQYTFGTSLMKAIEGDINADESMQNYG